MNSDFLGLLGIHKIAQRFGDDLKPELARLLTPSWDAYGHRVVPLDAQLKSSGPARQIASDDALAQPGVVQLSSKTAHIVEKDGTDG